MNGFYGECLRLEIFGQSHAAAIGMTLEGVYRNAIFVKGEYKTVHVCGVDRRDFPTEYIDAFYETFKDEGREF